MTKEEIIKMAKNSGIDLYGLGKDRYIFVHYLEEFAKLVAQREREACAEIVWPKIKVWSEEEQTAMGLAFNRAQEKHGWYETLMAVGASVLKIKAEAIRARGQE
jgi:hypothetical protein